MERSDIRNEADLLEDLLTPLVKRWGHAAVRRHLELLETREVVPARSQTLEKRPKHARRLTAREYVEKRVQIAPEKRSALLELATRFDEKRFLPSIADVRIFLRIKDPRDAVVAHREIAIPRLLKLLQGLSVEQLEMILRDENYAGPSRLAPLSEAIRDSGAFRFDKG